MQHTQDPFFNNKPINAKLISQKPIDSEKPIYKKLCETRIEDITKDMLPPERVK